MQHRSVVCRLRGLAPLLMHNGALADPLGTFSKELKRLSSKRDKTEADYQQMERLEWHGSLYLEHGAPVIPGEMLEALLVAAAKRKKRGPAAKAGIYCDRNFPLIHDGAQDIEGLWQDESYRFRCGVRVNGHRIVRMRPIFRDWQADVQIHFMDALLNESDVREFLEIGGLIVGLGDWRPKFGRFEVIERPN